MQGTAEKIETTETLETIKNELHQLTENMDEYQARLVRSFIKELFGLSD